MSTRSTVERDVRMWLGTLCVRMQANARRNMSPPVNDPSRRRLLTLFSIVLGITSAMCFLALASMPYAYFQLLRFSVCACFVTFSGIFFTRPMWAILAFGMAVLFNPFFRVELPRGAWMAIDLVVGLFLSFAAVVLWMTAEHHVGENK